MADEKRNRIVAAVTVNLIILVAILAAVIVYQLVQITIVSRNKNAIINEIKRLEQQTESEQKNLDYWQSQSGLEDLAYQYGFVYGK